MKKFLFTLAALLMVGTAYADDYLYIEDFSVTPEFLAQTAGKQRRVDVAVKAHFETYVSAWMVWVNPPEGIEMKNAAEGADMTIHTLDAVGNDKDIPVSLNASLENKKFIAANSVAGYYYPEGADPDEDDPVKVGAAKWDPVDYNEMFVITFQFAQDFTGGDIVVITEPSCSGTDPRGETCPDGQHHEKVCHVTVEGATQDPAPEPVITFTEDGSGVMIEIENYTECTVTVDGEQVSTEVPFYVEKDYDKTHEIEVYAKNAPEGYEATEKTGTYVLAEKQKEQNSKPSVTYTAENGQLTVWAYGCTEEDVEYTLYCDGVEYTGEMPITYDTSEGYNHTWTATAVSPTTTVSELSDPCEIVIDAVLPTYETPDPVIEVIDNPDEQKVTIIVTGEGALTMKVTKTADDPGMEGEVVYNGSGEDVLVYTIPYGDVETYYSVYATATADKPGYDVIPGDATEPFVVVPAKPTTPEPEVTATPTVEIDGYTVTATGDGTVYIYVDDEVVAQGEGTATYTINPDDYPEGAELGVTARAKEEGKEMSDWAPAQVVYVDAVMNGALNFSEVDQETGRFTVTYNGEEDVTITLDDETITLVRGTSNTYQLPDYGTYEVTATATAEGYRPKMKDATLVWTKAEEPQKPDAPEITILTQDDGVVVGATDVEGATVTFYQCDDQEGTNPREIENPTTFNREDETYNVYVYAVATNEAGETSSVVTMVVVPAKEQQPDPTAINEMNAGKTIAAVRYFNMAGQEMQEANGMTIVVTTYTDGTTSTVKVMK